MKDKINVLHLLSSLEVGGLEKLLLSFLNESIITLKDVNFTIVVMNDKVNEGLKKELLDIGYKVYFLNRQEGYKHPKYLFQLFKIINKNKIDIIHTHSYGAKMWSILCKILNPKVKTVYTIHDSIIIKELNKNSLLIHKLFIDANIAISKEMMNDCNEKKVKNPILIFNGLKLKEFHPKDNFELMNDILNILNVSRINHIKKGQDLLIKALKICKNRGMKFKCFLAGSIHTYTEHDKATYNHLKELIQENQLEDEITFLGTRHDIPELLNKSDVFVLPSRYEGLPVSILEAMASKLPIIASNISGANDLITTEENGILFESENYEKLAEKFLYLYHNQNIRELLANNAYNFVQDFNISVMCKKYYNVYKKHLEIEV